MSTDLSHSAFELRGGPTWADPWPMYTALRDRDPVHHVVPDNPEHDYWVLSRHADVWAAAVAGANYLRSGDSIARTADANGHAKRGSRRGASLDTGDTELVRAMRAWCRARLACRDDHP